MFPSYFSYTKKRKRSEYLVDFAASLPPTRLAPVELQVFARYIAPVVNVDLVRFRRPSFTMYEIVASEKALAEAKMLPHRTLSEHLSSEIDQVLGSFGRMSIDGVRHMDSDEKMFADIDAREQEQSAGGKEADGVFEDILRELIFEELQMAKKTVPLTVEEQAAAEAIIRSRPNVSIADKFNIPLTGKDVVCLRDGAWLTDEVMNFYTEMVLERNKALTVAANRDASGARTAISEFRQFVHNRVPRVHMFNTFFHTKMSERGYSYKAVERWAKRAKVDISKLDRIMAPIHVNGNHWTLASINLKDQQFEYYDSLGGKNTACLENLKRYLKDEWKAQTGTSIECDHWPNVFPNDIPRQMNGCDCGVFTLKFADYIADGAPLDFHQRDMPYFRRRLALELKQKQLL